MNTNMHAVLVGINDYLDLQPLKHSVNDTEKMKIFLTEELGAKEENVVVLKDSQATKDGITVELQRLATRAERNDAIVFFFSGYAGESDREGDTPVGVLCPHDVHLNGGISDKSLVQTFDFVSKHCGNNITVILDCVGTRFKWENPASCVIIYPSTATEDERGGMFTSAIIDVLKEQLERDQSLLMTVEAFSRRTESRIANDDVLVHCIGSNIDRPLFSPKADKGHYAMIPTYSSEDGRFILEAGAAHNIRPSSTFRIFSRNIPKEDFGEYPGEQLRVDTLNDITTILALPTVKLPPQFYVVEEPSVNVKIAIEGSIALDDIQGWEKALKQDENITLMEKDEKVQLMWNGLGRDQRITDRRSCESSFDSSARDDIQKEIRRAARFVNHVGAPPPISSESSISEKLRIKLHEVDTDAEKWTPKDDDLLEGKRDPYNVKVDQGERRGPYCLTIHNSNAFPVWPYVFVCDPDGFTILPWHQPVRGALGQPLGAQKTLIVGCDADDENLLFEYRKNRDHDFLYLKIFVTKDRTDFSFLQQWYLSEKESELRDYGRGKSNAHPPAEKQSQSESRESKKKTNIRHWTSKRITILVTYGEENEEVDEEEYYDTTESEEEYESDEELQDQQVKEVERGEGNNGE